MKENNNKNKNKKIAKKEYKLIQVFIQKILIPTKKIETPHNSIQDFINLSATSNISTNEQDINKYKNLLIDNRNYQINVSTEFLITFINKELNLKIVDVFVLPQKTWILIRFCSSNDLTIFREYLSNREETENNIDGKNKDKNVLGIGKFSSISDQLFDQTVKLYLPKVDKMISLFIDQTSVLGPKSSTINGLHLIPDFITVEEENSLISFVSLNSVTIDKLINLLISIYSIILGEPMF